MGRNVVFTGTLTAEERATVMRFAIEIGEKATCATNCLLRPFEMSMLEKAFREREELIEKRERAYIERARTFDPNKTSMEFRAYFGDNMTSEQYGKYIAELIKQEEVGKKMMRRSYQITVEFSELDPEDQAFHESLSPRVTFGDSNELHEECSFALTRDIKDALQDSSLGGDPEEGFDFGAFYVGRTPLYYQDLCVTAGGELVLSTVTRDGILDLFLSEEDRAELENFELNRARNRKIIEKLFS